MHLIVRKPRSHDERRISFGRMFIRSTVGDDIRRFAMKNEKRSDSKTEEMVEVYRKLGTPGAPHKLLAHMAGSWKTVTRSWIEPGQPPFESEGTCEQKMILEGRFLQQDFAGDMMGTPFKGIGLTGYDNHKQLYVSTWADSMSTGIFYFEGSAGADGRTITQHCLNDDPIKGPVKWRSVTRIVDDDTHEFEMYLTDRSDKEEKMMEIIYTRKK
jgi:hypothetical protein